MTSTRPQFKEETERDGAFRRQESRFRDAVSSDGSTAFPAEDGRYHLYVSWACPWAHRTIIGRRLKGLEGAVGMSCVDPIRDERGWAFTGGEFSDEVNGFEFLSEAYDRTDPAYDGRVSVPVLWDRETGRIVNNESGDILRMLDQGFGDLADASYDLFPKPLREEIEELNDRIYEHVNNGVYKAGFTTSQEIYEHEVRGIFEMLDELDRRLADRRYLLGESVVETDWRLFTTLARFDAVYYIHFKCSRRRLVDYEHLWPYFRDLYQSFGIADTVKLDQIRAHYYRTHPSINPNGLVAVLPATNWDEPHGRG
ncbi:MAG TPA: glutathione S-transferase C-terminal domain-containing protein [Thermoleophilaceae bacterium]|nr:glutathione S-transferase C-terminal domain-containing protein [Thermoleophilaceae bacterium]